jgi:chemotaxis protein CheD
MSSGAVLHVNIGCIACAEAPTVLKATLGSCVGIALMWPRMGKAALAHCLLPASDSVADAAHGRSADRGPARCVDEAVPALLAMLEVPSGQHSQLRAYLAGGAHMRGMPPSRQLPSVGELNVQAARLALALARIRLADEQVGGDKAMLVTVDCSTMNASSCRIEGIQPARRHP